MAISLPILHVLLAFQTTALFYELEDLGEDEVWDAESGRWGFDDEIVPVKKWMMFSLLIAKYVVWLCMVFFRGTAIL